MLQSPPKHWLRRKQENCAEVRSLGKVTAQRMDLGSSIDRDSRPTPLQRVAFLKARFCESHEPVHYGEGP